MTFPDRVDFTIRNELAAAGLLETLPDCAPSFLVKLRKRALGIRHGKERNGERILIIFRKRQQARNGLLKQFCHRSHTITAFDCIA